MRILTVCDYLGEANPSGAGRYLLETAKALRAMGHEVRILAGGEGKEEPGLFRFPFPASTGRARWLVGGGWSGIGKAHARATEGWKPERFLFHQPLSAAAVLRASGDGIPARYVFHSPWGAEIEARGGGRLQRWPRDRMERRVLAHCGKAVVLSDFMAGEMRKAHPELQVETRKIPGGADLSRFAFGERPGNARPVLVTVRRLVPRMGLDNLLGAMERLNPRPFLVIAGTGPLEQDLRKGVARRRLEKDVRLDGYVPEANLPALLGSADLFVLPSETLEGFGMVIPEALACGTPVLGTPVGAIPEVLGAFDLSLIAPSADPEGLAEGIRRALKAEIRRADCRAYAEMNFDWARAGRDLADFLA